MRVSTIINSVSYIFINYLFPSAESYAKWSTHLLDLVRGYVL